MPFSVTVIPRNEPTPKESPTRTYGQIFAVHESLTHPFHQMCMTALQSISAKTTPTCRKIVESICSSRCSQKTAVRGKVRPGILCPPPDGESDNTPWLYLMGTFDGEDENSLPQVYKEFSVVVATGPSTEEGKFTIRTVPEWQTSSLDKTQFLVTIPSTPPSGRFPTELWIASSADHSQAILIGSPEMQRLNGYSREKLFAFRLKLLKDRNYLSRVAIELRDEEIKYRRQKQRAYAASRRTAQSNIQQLQQGIAAMRLNDTTNTEMGRTRSRRKAVPFFNSNLKRSTPVLS
ncbi:hypothetical protein EDD18DRAFT_784132 [Armillaria luteobubalina]|uniref:Uncharacterized protein n=1 Tax=Armillaria luteobubalina TaxID=153913 RepID=A0AA39QDI0_9AGAR|nr:hypothetical protein EDD18DRAFT_784132 [Armillaria luteobubalina]